jgi:hypothetical protein
VDSWFGIFDCRQSRTRPATLWLPHLPAAQWTAPSTDLAVAQRHSDPWAWVHMRLHYRIGAAAQRASGAIRGKSGRDGTEYERSTHEASEGCIGLWAIHGSPTPWQAPTDASKCGSVVETWPEDWREIGATGKSSRMHYNSLVVGGGPISNGQSYNSPARETDHRWLQHASSDSLVMPSTDGSK